jgi:hypothetical protein
MRFNFFFVVSRDWQVRRDHQISLEISKKLPNFISYYISEELWTLGNASSEVSKLGSQKTLIVPRDTELGVPIWLSPGPFGDLDKLKIDFTNLLRDSIPKFNSETKSVLVYDGFGPTIDGFVSQIYSNWFSSSDSYFLFLQHGYLPGNFSHIFSVLKMRFYRFVKGNRSHTTRVPKNNYLSIVFDKYSFFVAVLSGSKISNTKIVGNFNLLGLESKSLAESEGLRIETGVVVYSTGSYRNHNFLESKEFEELVASVKKCMQPDQDLWIKLKSGELEMMSDLARSYLEGLGVHFAPKNLRMSEISGEVLVMASSSSNVGIEAMAEGRSLVLYTLDHSAGNVLRKHYQKLGVPEFNPTVDLHKQFTMGNDIYQKPHLDTNHLVFEITNALMF